MILLAVGYHYVAERAPDSPRAIFPVTTDALAAQLELLATAFEFVSRDALLAAVRGTAPLPERACVVTFDDGLRCQLEHALPVLDRLGVPAIFFVPGQPLAERKALSVHKLHQLRERLSDDEVAAELAREGVDLHAVDTDEARAHYRYDTPKAAQVKYLLNVALDAEERERIVDVIFARAVGDDHRFCDHLYMSPTDVTELERSHRAVGAHSYAHRALAALSPRERRDDLERSVAVLEPLLGGRPRAFSYPHGTPATVDLDSARDVERAGFEVAFTMERALNRTLEEPCLLGRLDANDAPGGTRPALELREGEPVVREGAGEFRVRYLDEGGLLTR